MNFKNLGCHIHKFPVGKWGFVGSVPSVLFFDVVAKQHHYLSGNVWKDEETGVYMGKSGFMFVTEQEARDFAKEKDVKLSN